MREYFRWTERRMTAPDKQLKFKFGHGHRTSIGKLRCAAPGYSPYTRGCTSQYTDTCIIRVYSDTGGDWNTTPLKTDTRLRTPCNKEGRAKFGDTNATAIEAYLYNLVEERNMLYDGRNYSPASPLFPSRSWQAIHNIQLGATVNRRRGVTQDSSCN